MDAGASARVKPAMGGEAAQTHRPLGTCALTGAPRPPSRHSAHRDEGVFQNSRKLRNEPESLGAPECQEPPGRRRQRRTRAGSEGTVLGHSDFAGRGLGEAGSRSERTQEEEKTVCFSLPVAAGGALPWSGPGPPSPKGVGRTAGMLWGRAAHDGFFKHVRATLQAQESQCHPVYAPSVMPQRDNLIHELETP